MSTVGKRVVLKLDGELEQFGFQVSLEIAPEGDRPLIETIGALPPNPELITLLTAWQKAYCNQENPSRIIPQEIVYRGSVNWLEECRQTAFRLREQLNYWLASPTFRPIDQRLRERLSLSEPIRILIRTQDRNLRRLPWHLWDFMEHYTRAEVALSAPSYERIEAPPTNPSGTVRILAILGHRRGIDIETDRTLLENLPTAEVAFLVEPRRQELNQRLWEQSWDILFFAGHSQSEEQKGRLFINPQESLTLEELSYGLRRAISPGEQTTNFRRLQLAIFNSCDGLGLAQELANLHLPQLIVMRHPVPDPVAQEFLKHFLVAFSGGESLYLATRQARERLQGLEGEFPCASWLPVICQNSMDPPPSWLDLVGPPAPDSLPATPIKPSTLAAIVFTDVESFTTKMEADEKHTLSLVRRDFQIMQQVCQQFEGQVLKSLGDGLLMSFTSAERAVSCAVEIQTQLATAAVNLPTGDVLKHRIGIHVGDVEFVDGDVLGSGVNIAARLQKEAPAGGICLSRTVYEVVKSRLSLPVLDAGLRSLKGIPDSFKVYQILPPVIQTVVVSPSRWTATSLRSLSWKRFRPVLLASWVVTSMVMGLRLIGALQPAELWAFDRLMQQRPGETSDHRLLLVTIDEADLAYQDQRNMQGRGSLSDTALNQLLKKLEPYKPAVIGLDIYRDRPVIASQSDLKTRLQRVVATCAIGSDKAAAITPPPEAPLQQLGFSNVVHDASDQVIRRHLIGMGASAECNTDKSLSYQLVRRYLGRLNYQADLINGQLQFKRQEQRYPIWQLQPHQAGYHQENLLGYQMMLNYRAVQPIAAQISLTELLSGAKDQQLPSLVNDRVILIGTIARSYRDYSYIPYGELPGVEIQAHMVSQLISAVLDHRPLIWWLPQWADGVWIWAWAIGGGMVMLTFRSKSHLVIIGSMVLVSLYGLCWLVFWVGGWLPLVPSILAIIGTGGTVLYLKRIGGLA